LDHRMYLFVPLRGTDRVVISAHGGREKNTKAFKVPSDVVLRFYSEDMNTVLDPGFNNFYGGEAAPKEICTEGDDCYDYTLSKYQGTGNNKMGETYDSIAKCLNRVAKDKNTFLTLAKNQSTEQKKSALLNAAAREKLAAVLTIRNRVFRSDVSLSYALAQVKATVPSIVIFDCLFCRWLKGGKDDAVPIVGRRF
jgi:hypothetical protein